MAIEAAFDVGSNSIKLLVADIADDGSYRVVLDQNEVTGLAEGLKPGGNLSPQGVTRTLQFLEHGVSQARIAGAVRIVAAGTSAMRDAADAPAFLQRVRKDLELDIRVVSGEEEARLSRAVALRELPPGSPDLVFFDVGGGSTELTLLHDGTVQAEQSLQLGARRATDAAQVKQPVTAEARAALSSFIEERLAQGAPAITGSAPPRIAGLGGTASTIVWMLDGQQGREEADPHLATLSLAQLEQLQADIAPLTAEQLAAWPNLNPARAPVIYAGVGIIAQLLRHYGAAEFTVADRGLRYGLLLA